MGYTILEMDSLPEALKKKPRWVTCVVFAAGVVAMTMSAIIIGAFIGYTYCYIEHRTGIRTGNITQTTNMQIVHLPLMESEEAKENKTINGALSSIIVSKMLKIGHAIMDEELACVPWPSNEPDPDMFR